MDVHRKFREFFSSLKFYGSKNCFYGSIWWFMKIMQYMGQLPIGMSSKVNETKVLVSRRTILIYWSWFAFFAAFAIYSHINLKFGLHHNSDPFARRVGLLQIIAISATSVVGAINMYALRNEFIKVKTL